MTSYLEMVQSLKATSYDTMADRLRDPRVFDVLHALMGLASEEPEVRLAVDETNLKEELGDCLFYCTLGLAVFDYTVEKVATDVAMGRWRDIAPDESSADALKRVIVYGKPLDDYKAIFVSTFGGTIASIIKQGWNLEELQEMNRAKLHRKRYPNGFSEEAALNRDLEEERKALEEAQQPQQ